MRGNSYGLKNNKDLTNQNNSAAFLFSEQFSVMIKQGGGIQVN